METGDTNYIFKNKLDKACFQHDIAYGKYKDLEKRSQLDKVLKDKALPVANNPKYDGYQRGLVSMVYKIFDKKSKRSQLDKVLKDKALPVANNPKYDGYQRGLFSMVYKIFDKKSKGTGIKNEIKQSNQLTNELHKPIIRKFKKIKVYSTFKDNIWGVDLADMQLISNYNKEIKYLLCAIDLFSKYSFVAPLERQKRNYYC